MTDPSRVPSIKITATEEFLVSGHDEVALMSLVQMLSSPVIAKPELILRGEFLELANCSSRWTTALLWVSRLQGVIPATAELLNQPTVKAFKPLGMILNSQLNLCKAIQNLLDEQGVTHTYEYPSALNHWKLIVQEARNNEVLDLSQSKGKRQIDAEFKEIIASLKNGDNPFDPHFCPHLWNLVQAVIDLGRHNKNDNVTMRKARKRLRDVAFKDFIGSLEGWKKKLKSDPQFKASHAEGQYMIVHWGGTKKILL